MSITSDPPPAKLLCWTLPQCKLQLTSGSSTCMHSWWFCRVFHQNQPVCFNICFFLTTMYVTIYAENSLVPCKFEPPLRSKFHSTLTVNPNQSVLGLCVILSPAIQRTLQQCPYLQWLCSLSWLFSLINKMIIPGEVFQISCQKYLSREDLLYQRCFVLRNY